MDAIAGNALLSSICLAVVLFVCLGLVFGFGWRIGAVAVVLVVAVNVFWTGGAPGVVAGFLRPFRTASTWHPPPPPIEKPSSWPNG
jgi:hypothetical protein